MPAVFHSFLFFFLLFFSDNRREQLSCIAPTAPRLLSRLLDKFDNFYWQCEPLGRDSRGAALFRIQNRVNRVQWENVNAALAAIITAQQ